MSEALQRTVDLDNGNKVHYKKDPRFGFWTVNFDKGGIPEVLKGQYTQVQYAEKAVEAYFAKRRNPAKPVKE